MRQEESADEPLRCRGILTELHVDLQGYRACFVDALSGVKECYPAVKWIHRIDQVHTVTLYTGLYRAKELFLNHCALAFLAAGSRTSGASFRSSFPSAFLAARTARNPSRVASVSDGVAAGEEEGGVEDVLAPDLLFARLADLVDGGVLCAATATARTWRSDTTLIEAV